MDGHIEQPADARRPHRYRQQGRRGGPEPAFGQLPADIPLGPLGPDVDAMMREALHNDALINDQPDNWPRNRPGNRPGNRRRMSTSKSILIACGCLGVFIAILCGVWLSYHLITQILNETDGTSGVQSGERTTQGVSFDTMTTPLAQTSAAPLLLVPGFYIAPASMTSAISVSLVDQWATKVKHWLYRRKLHIYKKWCGHQACSNKSKLSAICNDTAAAEKHFTLNRDRAAQQECDWCWNDKTLNAIPNSTQTARLYEHCNEVSYRSAVTVLAIFTLLILLLLVIGAMFFGRYIMRRRQQRKLKRNQVNNAPHEDGPYEDGPYEDGPHANGPRENGLHENGSHENGPQENGAHINGSHANAQGPHNVAPKQVPKIRIADEDNVSINPSTMSLSAS